MNFIKNCPTTSTGFGDDPWYLVTSRVTPKGKFFANQNCQCNTAYWAVETLAKYYPYSGDKEAFKPVRLILDRIIYYHTPKDWAWPNVPRSQDDTPDGKYTDEWSEPDKICSVGIAYIKFYKMTGEEKYLEAAHRIAKTIAGKIIAGNVANSPLPFRVNLKDGKLIAPYTSHMITPVIFFDEMTKLDESNGGVYQDCRDRLWKWIQTYPLKNYEWVGFYEDSPVYCTKNGKKETNKNQQSPIETARFLMNNPHMAPDYKKTVPLLLAWAENRFGRPVRYGAVSMREQDACFDEMSSHTARYASVAAQWFSISNDPKFAENARASFALATYSAYNKYSKGELAINYTGIGYMGPWFTDSYFDYMAHILNGMGELPEMAPADVDHILGSSSIITDVRYCAGQIEYTTFEPNGREILRITFEPKTIIANGKAVDPADWTYGDYHGASGILRINRKSAHNILISDK